MTEKFFKTGDIAKFHNASSDTVRYYDKEGLVKPSIVKRNKYRYYTLNETLNFGNVTMLRELNVPISSIKQRLGFGGIHEILSQNDSHIQDMSDEIMVLQRKINYLNMFNERLKSFHEKPNELEYIEDGYLYICRGMNFSMSLNEVMIRRSNVLL
ncbi:MerR family DNA-binding transcriptional regulator [Paenibacillus kribbensis]|uniref:MerR family DNA-binding transcriptional regulator n=1 Tax=Paenibacillus kribbensis TaxID=172713 RepID=UPI000838406E|nr:MerR family DNA-binding transcriptional regulator [Paenibacillus kribbensis]